MKPILSLCLVLICCVAASAQCVRCTFATREKQAVWVCTSSGSGAQNCATSSGQQSCMLSGICGALHGEDCSILKTSNRIVVSKDVIEAVAKESPVFADALELVATNNAFTAEHLKVFTIDNRAAVEIGVEIVYENGQPTSIKMNRLDNFVVLELYIQQNSLLNDEWTVSGWAIN